VSSSARTATIKVKGTSASGYASTTASLAVEQATSYIPVTGVSLNQTLIRDTRGRYYPLTATVLPSNATNKNVSWSSSNTSVATVSSTGNVYLNSPGNAIITVTTSDGGHTAICEVSAQKKDLGVVRK
jgi:uncharacterized protein YjdB